MKKNFRFVFSRILFLSLMFYSMLFSQTVFAQKDIPLYSTNFSDWKSVSYSGADGEAAKVSDYTCGGIGGQGFSMEMGSKPEISSGSLCAGTEGKLLKFRPFEFVSGGVLELTLNVAKSGKTISLSGVTVTSVIIESQLPVPPASSPASTVVGTTVLTGKNTGEQKITFYFSGSGIQTLKLPLFKCSDIYIKSMKLYSTIGAVPYVASVNYPKAPAAGYTISGTVGGALNSGTPVNTPINIKLWNSPSNVKLSVVGDDSIKFAFTGAASDGTLTVPNASAIGTYTVPLLFTPSILKGIAHAKLKIEASGCSPYYVSLVGTTGAATPQIIADTATIGYWTSLVANQTRTIDIAALNITGDVTLSITGSGVSNFMLSKSTILKADALSSTSVDVTYIADTKVSSSNAVLEIKSTSAPTVYVPLSGNTLAQRPELYELKFVINPLGSAVLTTSPTGTNMYPKGTTVNALVTPETGYAISYWSDAAGNKSNKRSFRVSSKKNGTITVNLVKTGCVGCTTVQSSYIAFTPNETANEISSNSFMARWSPLKDADETTNPVVKYEVVLYSATGTEISRFNAGTANNYSVTGLTPGVFYRYAVVATKQNATTKTTATVGLIQTTPNPTSFSCGN